LDTRTIAFCGAIFFIMATLCASPCHAQETPVVVAKVGNTAITGSDVKYRVETERAYGNGSMTYAAALVSLVNDSLELEAAKMRNVEPTAEELNAYGRYVDENTKAPEILNRVKEVFGADCESYERLYLEPKVVNMKLNRFYTIDVGVHAKERALIEKAYSLVAGGKTLPDAARKCGLKAEKFYFEDKYVTLGPELQRYLSKGGKKTSETLVALLEKMKPGEVFPNILEDDYAYRVVRLVKAEADKYLVEAITVEKRGYDELLTQDVSGIKVEISDPALLGSVRSAYPDLWWLK
jgi:hypothetical protein